MKLTKRTIDALDLPTRGDRLVFDEDLTGFALRVTAKGARIFLFQYWQAGKNHRLRLGAYGDLTPAAARKLAERARVEVAGGGNPAVDRRAAAVARTVRREADDFTFAVLAARWAQEGLKGKRPRYRAEAARALRVNFPQLAMLPADRIDAAAARRAVHALAAAHAIMARRSHAYARAAYAWAIKHDLVPHNPFAGVAIDGRETARERALTDVEIGEVWRAAAAIEWQFGPYLQVLMLTLQRREEVAGMRWSEIAADLSEWTLPGVRTKNGKAHIVHLAAPARAVLATVPRIARATAPGRVPSSVDLVFTTTGETAISGFSKAKKQIDKAIEAGREWNANLAGHAPTPLAEWRLHDLRRTGVTVLARLGVRWEVADRILNHVSGAIRGVAAVYQRHDYLAERAAALDIWAAHVLAVAGEAAVSD